jgi:hypothetical protein
MEMEALNGLTGTIERSRPVLMVEVDQQNDEAFHAFLEQISYRVSGRMGQVRKYKNYIVTPRAVAEQA